MSLIELELNLGIILAFERPLCKVVQNPMQDKTRKSKMEEIGTVVTN